MIEYAKVILPGVCFWEDLFKKELRKCVNWTKINERNELISWCYNTFGEMHPDILDKTFAGNTPRINKNRVTSYSFKQHKMPIKHRKIFEAA